nr:MAG TPA: ChiA1-BD-binding domain protein [Caudoviricetes sp.]
MRVFDESKTRELTDYDLSAGYLKPDKRFIAHHEATEAVEGQFHYETIKEYPNGGKDVKKVWDVQPQEAREAWDEYEDIQVYIPYTQEQINARLSAQYIPSATKSAAAVGKMLLKTLDITDAEAKLEVSGLYDAWEAGKYDVGDIRNHAGQTYECHQAHDNAVYPDITPDNPQTWATFWRPLHGKSAETARPWVQPMYGTTDMYQAGECMVYTDGQIYRAKYATPHSPEDDTNAWERVEEA